MKVMTIPTATMIMAIGTIMPRPAFRAGTTMSTRLCTFGRH